LLIFYGPGKGSTFSTQVPNLNPNRTAKDNFEKVGGRVRSLTGYCCFSMARGREAHFPFRVRNLNPTRTAKDHFEKVGSRVRSLTGH